MIPQTMLTEDGVRVVVTHYAVTGEGGKEAVACAPNVAFLTVTEKRDVPYHRTNDPRAVTCPLCRGSEAFRAHAEQVQSLLPEDKSGNASGRQTAAGRIWTGAHSLVPS